MTIHAPARFGCIKENRIMRRKSFATIIIYLISAMLLTGCGKSDDSSLTDRLENIREDAEENENEEENATTLDVKQAEKNLKESYTSHMDLSITAISCSTIFNQ